jgi:enamine deaminase RidA (YjgF/YER057c/UK114 family)
MTRLMILLLSLLALPGAAAEPATTWQQRIPAPGGEVILPDEHAKKAHDEWRYAAFKKQARRGLEELRRNLEAAGSDFQHVVMINSFHVWQGPNFAGTRDQQFWAFEEVISEFVRPPYPAWTAVGTTGLLNDGGIVEVQLIAKVK